MFSIGKTPVGVIRIVSAVVIYHQITDNERQDNATGPQLSD